MAIEPVVVPAAPVATVVEPAVVAPQPAAVVAAVEPAPVVAPVTVEAAKPAEPTSLIGAAEPPKAEESKPATTPTAALEAAKSAEAPKPAEPVKAAEPAKPAEAAKPEPKAFEYAPFKTPEGLALDPERVKALQDIITEAAPSAEVANATGQKLVDLYTAEVSRFQEAQSKVWADTQTEWQNQVRADPEIGGNRLDTTLQSCATVIDLYGGTAEQKAEIRTVLNYTGAGNHPAMVRFMSRIGKALGEGRPVVAPKPAPPPQARSARRYAGNGAQQP